MEQHTLITEEEREKCRKVVEVFAELENENTAIVAADAGRFGFVRLSYYDAHCGFGEAKCYTDSTALFNVLWTDWLNEQLLQIAHEQPSLLKYGYEKMFQMLPEKKRRELLDRRRDFARKSGIKDV